MRNRALWKGKISFGLISVPVRIYSSAISRKDRFRLLCKKHLVPVHHENVCESGHSVPKQDIVHGVLYENNRFVPIEQEDIKRMLPHNFKRITVLKFLQPYDVDEIFVKTKFYVLPMGSAKAYSILLRAMGETGLVAFGKIVFRNVERYVLLKPFRNVILMSTLYFPEEIRDLDKIFQGVRKKYTKKELALAKELISAMQGEFSKEMMKDEFDDALKQYVNAMRIGKPITTTYKKVDTSNTKNLLNLLRKSINSIR